MKNSRRDFVKAASSVGLGTAFLPFSRGQEAIHETTDYKVLDAVLSEPVLKKELFIEPVILESMELLHFEGNFICKARAKNGTEGISVSNNLRMVHLYPIFNQLVAPFFIGKDVRDLDELLDQVYTYKSNYKMQSYALWVPVATAEFAILDLLGKLSGLPLGALFGNIHHKQIGVYRANNFRGKSAEESIVLIQEQMAKTGSRALKFKVGGRMSNDVDYPPGRSEKLIPLIRKTFGSDMTVYADSNGSYAVQEAIRIGRMMEDHSFDFYEEPVPFDWYEETKEVKKALKIAVAGGEQEASMHNFRWLIGNDALDILQPDIFYFGGMIRSMRVAKMAHAVGKPCVPHISGSGLGYLYMLHFVSALPNAGPYHEFKGFNGEIPLVDNDLQIKDGSIVVPSKPGLGVEIDPVFIEKHKII